MSLCFIPQLKSTERELVPSYLPGKRNLEVYFAKASFAGFWLHQTQEFCTPPPFLGVWVRVEVKVSGVEQ